MIGATQGAGSRTRLLGKPAQPGSFCFGGPDQGCVNQKARDVLEATVGSGAYTTSQLEEPHQTAQGEEGAFEGRG